MTGLKRGHGSIIAVPCHTKTRKHRKSFGDIMKDLKRPQLKNADTKITQEQLDRYADIADLMRSR